MPIRINPDGSREAIYSDHTSHIVGGEIRRASNVEPITTGPFAGQWFIDFSPLGEPYRFCMLKTFPKRQEALAEEVRQLTAFYFLRKEPHV